MLNGGAFSWKSGKQNTIADSTTEAEYIAASEAVKEAVWIRSFMVGLGVMPNLSNLVSLFCDNTGAIAQAKEPRSHNKSMSMMRSRIIGSYGTCLTGPWSIKLHRSDQYEDGFL